MTTTPSTTTLSTTTEQGRRGRRPTLVLLLGTLLVLAAASGGCSHHQGPAAPTGVGVVAQLATAPWPAGMAKPSAATVQRWIDLSGDPDGMLPDRGTASLVAICAWYTRIRATPGDHAVEAAGVERSTRQLDPGNLFIVTGNLAQLRLGHPASIDTTLHDNHCAVVVPST